MELLSSKNIRRIIEKIAFYVLLPVVVVIITLSAFIWFFIVGILSSVLLWLIITIVPTMFLLILIHWGYLKYWKKIKTHYDSQEEL